MGHTTKEGEKQKGGEVSGREGDKMVDDPYEKEWVG